MSATTAAAATPAAASSPEEGKGLCMMCGGRTFNNDIVCWDCGQCFCCGATGECNCN